MISSSGHVLTELDGLSRRAENAYELLHRASLRSLARPGQELRTLMARVLRVSHASRTLVIHLRHFEDAQDWRSSGVFDFGRLSACADAVASLEENLTSRGSESTPPSIGDARNCQRAIGDALPSIELALQLDSLPAVLRVLSGATKPAAEGPVHAFSPPPMRIPKEVQPGQKMFDALRGRDYSTILIRDLIESRCPGTGDWIFEDDDVKQWISGGCPRLHFSGSPGCGKSVLAAIIVEKMARTATSKNSSLCYFFVDHFEASSKRLVTILSTLLVQALSQSLAAYTHAEKLFGIDKVTPEQTLRARPNHIRARETVNYRKSHLLAEALRQALGEFDRSYIVLDGLDDLDPHELQNLFSALATLDLSNTRILIFSRPLDVGKRKDLIFVHPGESYHSRSISAHPEDIRIYARKTSTTFVARGDARDESFDLYDEKTWSSLALTGNFQYVQCQLWYMQFQRPGQVQLILPYDESLASTYKAILDAIVDRESNVSENPSLSQSRISKVRAAMKTSFAWLHKLSHSDAESFISVRFPKQCFFEALSLLLEPDARSLGDLEPPSRIEARFAWYFDTLTCEKIDRDRQRDTLNESTQSPYFALRNRTFSEYVANPDSNSGLGIDLPAAYTSLTLACLRYLNLEDFSQCTEEVKLEQRRSYERNVKHPFYSFSAGWWPELSRDSNWDAIKSQIFTLFSLAPLGSFATWFLEYCNFHFPWKYELRNLHHTPRDLIKIMDDLAAGPLSSFHISAALGITPLCRAIAESLPFVKADIDRNSSFGAPLALAVLGPRAFALGEGESLQDFYADSRHSTGVMSINQKATIRYLLELGASGGAKMSRHGGEGFLSLAPSALMTCALLEDAQLFIDMAENRKSPRMLLDIVFAESLQDFFFPIVPGIDTKALLTNALAIAQKRVLTSGMRLFLNNICEYLIDKHINMLANNPDSEDGSQPAYDDLPDYSLVSAAWNCARNYNLDCSRPDVIRPIDCSDTLYAELFERNLREFRPFQMLRLMQDKRWESNRTLTSSNKDLDESAGQTALHIIVEAHHPEAISVASALIVKGADVNFKDARDRTPLHLAEDPNMLHLLISRGADTAAQDGDDRTIWHVAAANNDTAILRALKDMDPNMHGSLRKITRKGRTPLAEALAYFHERPRWAYVQGPEEVKPSAAQLLLRWCKGDPDCFRSDLPLIHLTVEWGQESLLESLDEAGGVQRGTLSPTGETAFHFLNVGTTRSFVEALRGIYGSDGLSMPSVDGKLPVEAFMDSFVGAESASVDSPPQHTKRRVDPGVFDALVTPEVVSFIDQDGKRFWERFCYNTVAIFCDRFRESQHAAVDALFLMIEALTKSNAMALYEEQSSTTAFLPLVTAVWKTSRYIPSWFSVPCVAVLLQTTCFEPAREDENVILTLRWAITGNRNKLVDLLFEKGASVHSPARGLSIFDECCKYDMAMFAKVLLHADKTRLNELNQFGRAAIHTILNDNDSSDRRGVPLTIREDKLVALLNAGADINLRMEDQMTPVILATMKGHQTSAITLLDMGADTGAKLPDGLDVSLAAASRGCIRVLRKLKEMNIPDWDWTRRFSISVSLGRESWKKRIFQGCHALHIAALNCQTGSLIFYLAQGLIPIEEPCFDHMMTALHFAAIGGASDAIRYLVEQGANINAANINGLTPLHVAVQARHPDAVRTLLRLGCEKAPRDRDGRTPLLLAIQWNVPLCFSVLKQHIVGRLIVDYPSYGPQSAAWERLLAEALENSIMQGDTGAITTVVGQGCSVDAIMPSCGGCSGLALAVRIAKPAVVKMLLEHGAARFTGGCQRHSLKGISVVFEAAVRPQASACLRLVLDGALRLGHNWLNAQLTPLHVATQQRNLAGVNGVLKHLSDNADSYRKWLVPRKRLSTNNLEKGGPHPVVMEVVNRHVTMPDDHYYTDNTTALHLAISNDVVEIAGALVKQGGADVNALDSALCTPLHRAVGSDSDAGIKFLLENGATVDLRDRDGYTPLMRAARAGSVEMCQLLIELGKADVQMRDADGMSLLSCCAEQSRSPALFAYLCSPAVGLDPYARDKTTYSPLHDAVLNSNMTGYVFAGQFDLHRVADGVDLLKGLITLVVEDGSGRSILPRLWRRWPRHEWGRYVNACPPRYVSPLSMAAIKGFLWEAEFLVSHGADVELEGSAEGTALMAACAHGRMDVVELLVRRGGARIAYNTDKRGPSGSSSGSGHGGEGEEEIEVRNALEYAVRYPEIVRWLLVGRYTDQGKIADAAFEAHGPGRPAGGEAEPWAAPIRPWSGVAQVQYASTGTNRDYTRTHKETQFAYLVRINEFKASLQGTVVVPYKGDHQ